LYKCVFHGISLSKPGEAHITSRCQVDQGAGNVPPVATGLLFGQPENTELVATTSRTVCHINPIDASAAVQGSWFVGMPSQAASVPSVLQPATMVNQVATPPIQVIVSAAGPSMPAYVTWVDGIGYVPQSVMRSVTSVTTDQFGELGDTGDVHGDIGAIDDVVTVESILSIDA